MKNKGFTLIEVSLVIVILIFIIAGIYMVLNIADKSWHWDLGLLELQQQARSAMDGMPREIRQSRHSDINITNNGTRADFSIPSASGLISYYLENNQIIREHPLGTTKILASDINYLNFTLASHILDIRLKAKKSARGREIFFPLNETGTAQVLKEKVRLRND